MEFTAGRTCSICGAPITDDNPDGIGFGCREAYRRATYAVYLENQDRRNEYYNLDTEPLIMWFVEQFSNTKFRSAFRKSFYPSIVAQYQTRGFLSKNQKDIVRQWLNVDWDSERRLEGLDNEVKSKRKTLFRSWIRTPEEQSKVHGYANKFRHE